MKNTASILLSLMLLGSATILCGQDQKSIAPIRHNFITWQQYDSLGDAAMFHGDTSEAIACYERSIELNPIDKQKMAAREKLRRYYQHVTSSFYLKEY